MVTAPGGSAAARSRRAPLCAIASVERGGLVGSHAVQTNRHAQRGRLIIGDVPAHVIFDEVPDLFRGKRLTVTFCRDNFDDIHIRYNTRCPSVLWVGLQAEYSLQNRAQKCGGDTCSDCPSGIAQRTVFAAFPFVVVLPIQLPQNRLHLVRCAPFPNRLRQEIFPSSAKPAFAHRYAAARPCANWQ